MDQVNTRSDDFIREDCQHDLEPLVASGTPLFCDAAEIACAFRARVRVLPRAGKSITTHVRLAVRMEKPIRVCAEERIRIQFTLGWISLSPSVVII